jgi:Zn finger protein HypA/HybF involved in hydrogenase expression
MKYRLIIDDPIKALEREKWSYRNFPQIAAQLQPREVGSVFSEAEMDCPAGGVNCRNCGDPEYTEECLEKGHCPNCGTKHGISPDVILNRYGFRLEQV